jgi:hypothetical protein
MEVLGKSCSEKKFIARLDLEICVLKFEAEGVMSSLENQEKQVIVKEIVYEQP